MGGLEKRLANLRPYKPGQNRHTTRRERIDARLAELAAEYFPNGGYSVMDAHRMKLAAMHYIVAETARDPTVSVRSTRTAEYLLAKLSRSPAPRSPAADQAALAIELLLNKPQDGV